MVTQLNGEEPASKMLTSVPIVWEQSRQLARNLFTPATESSFAKMVATTLQRQRLEIPQPRRKTRRSDRQAACLYSTFSGARRLFTQR